MYGLVGQVLKLSKSTETDSLNEHNYVPIVISLTSYVTLRL